PTDFVPHLHAVVPSGSTIRIPRWRLVLSGGLCGILLVSLGFLTWRQIAEYHNLFSLYTATLQKNPSCWMAHYNLGIVLSEQGETNQAIDHYRRAVGLRPDYAEAHYNLGRLLVEQGQLDDAIAHYERATATDPADEEARYNLASALLRKGRADEAIIQYQKVLQMHSESADAHANLGSAWLAKGHVRDAIEEYTRALQISPENLAALSNLAWLLATSADPSLRNGSEAVRLAERADSASSRSETHPTILRILAAAYAEAGQFAAAK